MRRSAAAAGAGLGAAAAASLASALARGVAVGALLASASTTRAANAAAYAHAYGALCLAGRGHRRPKLAPFHLLASEGAVHVDKDHVWHMAKIARARRAPTRR